MKEPEMEVIADLMCKVLEDHKNEDLIGEVREKTRELCEAFPLYAEFRR